MRYVDGPTVECDLHLAADPARVWELVTDIELPTRFSTELRRVRWLDGIRGPALGARFEGHNHHPALGEWRTISHVVRFDEQQVFGWVVLDPDNRFGGGPVDLRRPAAAWQFRLAPEGDGCRLVQSVRIGPGRSGVSLVIDRSPENEEQIIEHRRATLRDAMTATLQGIRGLAEQPR
ncbi:SRPBCC family protein [Micromonospora sp. NPDC047620]|uniref:SRPBCC family protein n=1 Tax=Micromonospora sp. NPDC047620 TaxID=3364251 RepID=UPI003719FD8E